MRPFAPRLLRLTVVLIGCSDAAVPVAESSSSETGSTSTDASAATSSDEVASTALDSTAVSDSSSSDGAAAESISTSDTGTPMPEICATYSNVAERAIWVYQQSDALQLTDVECVIGGVIVEHGPRDDVVVDISAAASLRAIDGILVFEETVLTDLAGFEQLEWVSGEVDVGVILPDATGCAPNRNLQNLDALSALQHLETLFVCGQMEDSLVSIDGLDAALDGDIAGQVTLIELQMLASIGAMSGVTGVADGIVIRDVPMLADLSPLSNVSELGNLFVINTGVEDLEGLDSLTDVEFTVIVSGNPSLTTLAGLDALVSTTDLFISGNPLLPQAEAEAFAESVAVTGEIVVCGNLDGPPC